MSLREYVLRRQASTRDTMKTVRLEVLPILNAWTESTVDLDDFFSSGPTPPKEKDIQSLKALRYDLEQSADRDIDFTPVDRQLTNASKDVRS
jgi:hypothetical protein